MKILYITTIGATMGFFKSFIKQLLEDGNTVDIAANQSESSVPDCYKEWGCSIHQIDCCRSPLDQGNLLAIKQIKQLVEQNHYDIVHCHTPIAAMCTRIACRNARKKGTKVFYTAHGFHFYKGAPLKNWLIYYPVEWMCAHWTDTLITINQEDYALAQKKMKAKKVVYVPGVGIDLNRFGKTWVDKQEKRHELGVPDDAVLLLSVGELNQNKNHETVIRAIVDMENVHYVIAGQGESMEHLQSVITECGAHNRVKLLGYRNDIGDLCEAADIFVFPSFREGLSVALMEAMASGLPVVCSKIRGNTDLIDNNGGALFDPRSVDCCKEAIRSVMNSDYGKMGLYNADKVKKFSLENVSGQMSEIIGGVDIGTLRT